MAGETRTRVNQFVRNFEGNEVVFRHGPHGEDGTRPVVGTYTLNGLNADVLQKLAVVGLAQVLTAKANDDGDAIANVSDVYQGLVNGNWPESQRGGGRTADETVYHEALVLLAKAQGKGKVTVERAAEIWTNMPDAKKEELKNNTGFKALVVKIRADRAVAKKRAGVEDITLDW
jgi:hypothetical protein